MSEFARRLHVAGFVYLAAALALVVSRAPLGSPFFFICIATAALAYLAVLPSLSRAPARNDRLLVTALLFAIAFRVPMAVAPVGADNDMVRYIWDGRVQRFGYNPYNVVPADPSLAHTHTDQTRQMPSLRAGTPYPPAAQLFFRFVTSVSESTRAMKLALVACDVLTILVLWRWLLSIGSSPWLALVYAWNPLVVLEVAHSGHIDALGALWITASAYWLTGRRTALATVALVLAIATKLLPIVLAPLYWRRIKVRDALAGAAVLAALYLPFAQSTRPLGSVPNVVAYIRFNGPLFETLANLASPTMAAGVALLLGLAAATWARRRLAVSDAAAWAWPMALSLACAPVIYPWYLLYFTPFLWSRSTVPLLAWTFSSIPVYVVWERSRHGGRWIVPAAIEAFEFGAVVIVAAALLYLSRRRAVRGELQRTDELA